MIMTDKEYYEKINKTDEEWRRLILFHHVLDYDVSNLCRIRKHSTKKILKLSYNKEMKNCYRYIQIKLHNGKKYNTEIHRLAAIMFIPVPKHYLDEGYTEHTLTIEHKDGVKYHNILENLEWLTMKENVRNAFINGLCSLDKRIESETANDICKMISNGYPIFTIAESLNVSESVVASIRYKQSWTDISKYYTFPSKQLTENTVRIICEYISKGYTNKNISNILKIKESTIEHIRLRHTWADISNEYDFPMKRIKYEEALKICEMLQDGMSLKKISEKTGISKRTIEHIRKGDTWTEVSKNFTFTYSNFKVDDNIVHNICKSIISGKKTMKEIAKENGVSLSFVKDLKYGKSRRDITEKYNIGLSK